jgi:hypothetical protein
VSSGAASNPIHLQHVPVVALLLNGRLRRPFKVLDVGLWWRRTRPSKVLGACTHGGARPACLKVGNDSPMTSCAENARMLIVPALLRAVFGAFFAAFRPKASLVLENLALRHQLAVLQRAAPRPKLRPVDRAFWVLLSGGWSRWTDVLAIVKPATVVGWHGRGFAWFWARKSRPIGRPALADEIVALIRRMAAENPLWSRRRIAAELAKLGHNVSKDTVAKYMPRRPRQSGQPRSPTWSAFLRMHLPGTIAIDFLGATGPPGS